jgi:hypothetical protein
MLQCFLMIAAVAAGPTGSSAAADLPSEVQRLVRRLDSPQLAQREAAEAELLRRGPAILDLLPPTSDRTPAEVRQRLGRVRQQLERQAARAAADASTITLRADGMRLSQIVAAFQRQSGNPIIDGRGRFGQPDGDPPLDVRFDKTPFWAALDQVLDRAGLTVYPYSERRAIEIVGAGAATRRAGRGRVCYSGPLRIEATEVVARRGLRRTDDRSLTVAVEVAWEPRVRVIRLVQRLADVTATDDRQRPLPVSDAAAQLEAAGADRGTAVKFDLPLGLPPREAHEIASLKGKLTATIAGQVETFRFQDLPDAKNVAQRIAGVTVTLEGVQKTAQGIEVRILVRFDDAGDALASHRTWIFDNPAFLETPGGKPLRYDSYDTTAQSKDAVGLAFRFTTALPLMQLRFVYQTPGAIINRAFEYELRRIELP